VDWAKNGADADRYLSDFEFDLVLLNLLLQPTEGFSVLQRMRDRHTVSAPVLALSARPSIEERVRALDMGADDYMAVPFDFRDFEARSRCLLRRRLGESTNQVVCARITLDLAGRTANIDGQALNLSRREVCLLEILMANRGRTLSKERLLQRIYRHDNEPHENAVEVLMARLRRKLIGSGVEVTTHRGLGYSLSLLRGPTTCWMPRGAAASDTGLPDDIAVSYGSAYA